MDSPETAAARTVASWRDYLELTKPRVVALLVLTAVVGSLLATPGLPPLDTLLLGNLGIGLAAASAAAINHVIEEGRDEVQQLLGSPVVARQVRRFQGGVNALPDTQRLVDIGRHLGVERQGDRDHGPKIAQQIGLMRKN